MLGEISKIYFTEGLRLLREKKLNTAQINFQKAVLINNNNWEAVNLLGMCLYALGEFKKAKALWESSINLNSKDDNRAYYYVDSFKEDEFITNCNLYNRALQCAMEGKFKIADEFLKAEVLNSCEIISFINLKGICKLALGKNVEAAALWERSLKINKENEDALKYIIESYNQREKYKFFYYILQKIFKKA